MKSTTIFAHGLVFSLFALPVVASAAGLVPCGGGGVEPECDFNQLILMVNGLIKFVLFKLAVPIAALAFMWAGASLVLQQDKHHAWTEAKERFANIAIGFIIIMVAFIGIKFVLFTFLTEEQKNFLPFLMEMN